MLKQLQLERLSDTHLLLFQKHIELGQEHLRTLLSQEGVEELCAEDEPSAEAQSQVKSNVTERAGALTLPFNGVLTAALGAWLGFDGFLGYFLRSKALFQGVIAVSVGLGAWIAAINYRSMKRDIQRRVEERTLQDIQLHILDFLIQKRTAEIGRKTGELNELLKTMKVTDEEIPPLPSTEFDSEEECLGWLEKFDCVVKKHRELENPEIYDLFAWEISASKEKIRENLRKNATSSRKALPPVLEMLMRTPLRAEKRRAPWLSKNWKQVFLGTIPTLYGGFSSMFVYLNGAPEIATHLGWKLMHTVLMNPWVRMAEMAGAIGATLYFAISFINAHRKGFLRDQEIANMQQMLVQREGKLSMVSERLSKVKETLLSLQRIELLLVTLKKVSSLIPPIRK